MKRRGDSGDLVLRRTRSAARACGLLLSGLYFVILVLEIAEADGLPVHTVGLLILLGILVLGVLSAWRWERVGGVTLIGSATGVVVVVWASTAVFGVGEADLLLAGQALAGLALLTGTTFLLSDKATKRADNGWIRVERSGLDGQASRGSASSTAPSSHRTRCGTRV